MFVHFRKPYAEYCSSSGTFTLENNNKKRRKHNKTPCSSRESDTAMAGSEFGSPAESNLFDVACRRRQSYVTSPKGSRDPHVLGDPESGRYLQNGNGLGLEKMKVRGSESGSAWSRLRPASVGCRYTLQQMARDLKRGVSGRVRPPPPSAGVGRRNRREDVGVVGVRSQVGERLSSGTT